MNKYAVSIITFFIIITTSSVWGNNFEDHNRYEQHNNYDSQQYQKNDPHEKRKNSHLKNLSAAEKKIIKNLKKEIKKLGYLHKAKMIDIKSQLHETLAAEQFNKNKFLDLSAKKIDLKKEKHEMIADALAKLSPAARAVAIKMIHKKQHGKKNKRW